MQNGTSREKGKWKNCAKTRVRPVQCGGHDRGGYDRYENNIWKTGLKLILHDVTIRDFVLVKSNWKILNNKCFLPA